MKSATATGRFLGPAMADQVESILARQGTLVGLMPSASSLGSVRFNSAAAINPQRLAAESSTVSRESLLRALRQADTAESRATAKLISRDKLKVNILESDPSGRGLGGLYVFGTKEINIYRDSFSNSVQSAGFATHEATHFMQGLTSRNYHLGHEYQAFRAQGAVDKSHWVNGLSDRKLYDILESHPVYRGVPRDPNWAR